MSKDARHSTSNVFARSVVRYHYQTDSLIDLYGLTTERDETTAGFTVERLYRLFIVVHSTRSEISVDIGIQNGTKTSFGIHYNEGNRESRVLIKFATDNC